MPPSHRKKLSLFLLALLLVCLLLPQPPFAGISHAEAAPLSARLKDIQGRIKEKEKNLRKTSHMESSVSDELKAIEGRLAGYESRLRREKKRIKNTEARIGRASAAVGEDRRELKVHQKWLDDRLIAFQMNGRAQDLVMLLGADDMGSFLRRWRYLEILAKLEAAQVSQYRAAYGQLVQKEAELQALRDGLKRHEARTAYIHERLNSKRRQKDEMLASIRSRKTAYEAELKQLRAASRRLAEIIRRASRHPEFAGKGFRALKGRMPWPVAGMVVYGYGRGTDPVFGTPVFREGIYIETAPNAPVKAVFSGRVVFANRFKGYGRLVIIDHGSGYYSVYADLNEIFLRVGDIINAGTRVGRAGESAMVKAPSLYFEVRYRGKPLNPLQWLARR